MCKPLPKPLHGMAVQVVGPRNDQRILINGGFRSQGYLRRHAENARQTMCFRLKVVQEDGYRPQNHYGLFNDEIKMFLNRIQCSNDEWYNALPSYCQYIGRNVFRRAFHNVVVLNGRPVVLGDEREAEVFEPSGGADFPLFSNLEYPGESKLCSSVIQYN